MKTYKKPETKVVLFPAGESIMQVIETSTGTGNVGGYDNPDDPDLAPAHHVNIEEVVEENGVKMDSLWRSFHSERSKALGRGE